MALTQAQITAEINSQLQTQLQNAWGSDSSLGQKWLATGSTGGAIIYPQGQQGNATSAAYYYPTYQALNKTVSTDENGVSSVSETTFTSYLANLYGGMEYALSATNQTNISKSRQLQSERISDFYNNTWLPVFGDRSSNFKNNPTTAWAETIASDQSNLSPDQMMDVIQSSFTWSVGNAYGSEMGLNSGYSSDKSSKVYISPNALIEGLTLGSITYEDAFTGMLDFGRPMSWSQQMASEYAAIQSITGANNKLVGQQAYQKSLVDTAATYLKNVDGNSANAGRITSANSDAYGTVYTGGVNPGGFPEYIPYPGVFGQTSENVRNIIQGTNTAGTDFSIYIDSSSGDSVQIGKDSSSAASFSSSASYRSWFFRAKASASASTYTDTTFQSADANADATSGTISFKNSYYQTWNPPQSGQNSWFMLNAIKSAFTNGVSSGKLPYTQSPNFVGGWGFTDSNQAKSYLMEGFQYIKSLAYSANPTTTVSVSSASDNSTFYNSNTFSNSSFSSSAGIGYGSWFGGVNASVSASGSTSSSSKTTSSTYNSSARAYEVTNSGIGSTNESPALAYGYGAMQIGVSVNTPVAPLSSSTVNNLSGASSKKSGSDKYSLPAVDLIISREKNKGYYISDNSDNGQHISFPDRGRDLYVGDKGADIVSGGNGKDELYGHGSNDRLSGGGGIDFISGGMGKNILTGGRNRDYFELDAAAATKSDRRYRNIVTDFNPNRDTLWLTNNADMSELSFERRWITYGGEKTMKLLGLTPEEMSIAVNTAESAMGF